MELGQKTEHAYIYYDLSKNRYNVRVKLPNKRYKVKPGGAATLQAAIEWRDAQLGEPGATVAQMVNYAKNRKKDHKNKRAIYLYLDRIRDYFGEKPVDDLRPSVIEQFADYLKETFNQADDSVRKHLSELQWIMNRAIRERLSNQVFQMPKLDPCGIRKLHINLNQFKKVIAHLPAHQRPILRMAFITMQRKHDVLNMRWDQFDGETISYIPSKTSKFYREPQSIVVPIHLRKDLQSLPRLSEFMFLNPYTGKPYENITKSLNTACKRAGVPRFTFHHIKHLGISEALRISKNIFLVSKLSATSPKLITDRYGKVLGQGKELTQEMSSDLYMPISV